MKRNPIAGALRNPVMGFRQRIVKDKRRQLVDVNKLKRLKYEYDICD